MTDETSHELAKNHHSEIETSIEVGYGGTYSLIVDGRPMVKVVWLHGVRHCLWAVHGPADLELSIALMKGFIHLTAMMAREDRVYKQPPDEEVLLENLKENENVKHQRRPQSASPVVEGRSYRRKKLGKGRQG